MRVRLEHAVFGESAGVTYAVFDGKVVREGAFEDLLALSTDNADKIARAYTLSHGAHRVGIHLDPAWVVLVPGDIELVFGVVVVAVYFALFFFGYHSDKLGDAGFVFLASIEVDGMAEVVHHVAELANFLSEGAVSVFGSCLGVREAYDVESKLSHGVFSVHIFAVFAKGR